jgi:hypothetical protein
MGRVRAAASRGCVSAQVGDHQRGKTIEGMISGGNLSSNGHFAAPVPHLWVDGVSAKVEMVRLEPTRPYGYSQVIGLRVLCIRIRLVLSPE